MAGYSRQSAGSIVTSSVITAASHNAEYNAVQAAFDSNSGHKHDGTTSEGAPITVTGPAQDFVFSGASITPKTTDVYSLGTTTLRMSSGWFQGAVTAAGGFVGNVTGNLTGNLATARTISVGTDATGGVSFNGSANVTIPLTLNTVNSSVGVYGGATAGIQFTVNAKGLITAASNVTSNRVAKAGDTMTGTLTGTSFALDTNAHFQLSSGNPTITFDSGDNINYNRGTNTFAVATSGSTRLTVGSSLIQSFVPVQLPADPTSALHAATKQYVDAAAFSATIGYTPVQQGGGGGQLSTKVYVGWSGARLKAQVDSTDLGNIAFDSHLSNYLPLAGGNLTGALTLPGLTTSSTIQVGTGAIGTVYLGATGTAYIDWDGTNYNLGTSGAAWHSGNLTPGNYALKSGTTFTGGVSGTTLALSGGITATTGGFSGRVTCLPPNSGTGGYAWTSDTTRVSGFNIDGSANLTFTIDGAARGVTTFASDERLKQDITPASEDVLPLLKQIEFVDFRFKKFATEANESPMQRGGFIAQQIRDIKPEWVSASDNPDDALIPNVQLLLTNALKAIVELSDKVDALQAEVNTLKAVG